MTCGSENLLLGAVYLCQGFLSTGPDDYDNPVVVETALIRRFKIGYLIGNARRDRMDEISFEDKTMQNTS